MQFTSFSNASTSTAPTGVSFGAPTNLVGITSILFTFTVNTIITTVMTYGQLDGLANKWSLELEDQEKHFLRQATQVNAWDHTLIEN
ncbi:nucleoporin-62 C-terminal-like protein, partial [Delphinapterus leucas]|uniref:Nucleoporin-62 C-terminal-like protein n=1 Tax=Delphinapterus leucas TaxID=9749 RepID=A0A7F8K8K4_DELLE